MHKIFLISHSRYTFLVKSDFQASFKAILIKMSLLTVKHFLFLLGINCNVFSKTPVPPTKKHVWSSHESSQPLDVFLSQTTWGSEKLGQQQGWHFNMQLQLSTFLTPWHLMLGLFSVAPQKVRCYPVPWTLWNWNGSGNMDVWLDVGTWKCSFFFWDVIFWGMLHFRGVVCFMRRVWELDMGCLWYNVAGV